VPKSPSHLPGCDAKGCVVDCPVLRASLGPAKQAKPKPTPLVPSISAELLEDLRPLSPKQRAFVLLYLGEEKGNATASYRRAYGVKQKVAETAGPRLLGNVRVAGVIAKHTAKVEKRLGLTVEALDRELARITQFDPAKLVDEDGVRLPIHKLDEDTRRALVGVDVEELFEGRGDERVQVGQVVKTKWHNKTEAIHLGYRRLGAIVEKHEIKGPSKVVINMGVRRAPTPKPPKE
jgi:phage terminase small subunit